MMDYAIRPVRPNDALSLAMIQTESWKAAFSGILSQEELEKRTELSRAINMYARLLENHTGHGYIGELDGRPHCIAWWDKARGDAFLGYAEIICIHSLPDHWRQGYGSRMMDRLLTDIAAAGYQKAILWVFRDNDRARAFYEKKGFVLTSHTQQALDTVEVCYEIETSHQSKGSPAQGEALVPCKLTV